MNEDACDQELEISRGAAIGSIRLNRPLALNALSHKMVRGISECLEIWRDDPAILAVIFVGTGRAFCAGGDVKRVYRARFPIGPDDATFDPAGYFADEYRMNIRLQHYPKPTVALMNGIVMGGGFGIAGPCRYRVAGTSTRFAMPETGIGFFPDVGSAWSLARLPGGAGLVLGVGGMTIGPADMAALGLSTHFIPEPETLIDRLDQALASCPAGMRADTAIERILAAVAVAPPVKSLVGDPDRFAGLWACHDIAAFEAALTRIDPVPADILHRRSPLAKAVALRHIGMARNDRTFADTVRRDFRLVQYFLRHPDFLEGIRCALIDKGAQPFWQAVPEDREIDAIFAGDTGDLEL